MAGYAQDENILREVDSLEGKWKFMLNSRECGIQCRRYEHMEIKEMSHDDWKVLALTDRLDTQTAPELETKGLSLLEGNPKIALDFAELQYISSAGLRVLLLLAKKAKAAGGSVVLTGVDGMVKEVIEESGIDAFFTIYGTVESLP